MNDSRIKKQVNAIIRLMELDNVADVSNRPAFVKQLQIRFGYLRADMGLHDFDLLMRGKLKIGDL